MLKTLRTGASSHPEETVLQLHTDLIGVGGVLTPYTSYFNVTQQGSPNMTVLVGTGRAFIKGTGNCYPVQDTSTNNVTITANASGSTRIDAIVLYIDLSASPSSDGSGVATLIAVAGTPSGSPVAPVDATIQSTIGASNPFIRLANVTVASGASSITNANIDNTVRPIVKVNTPTIYTSEITTPATPASGFGAIYEKSDGKFYTLDDSGVEKLLGEDTYYTSTDGATITLDLNTGKNFTVTLGGNRTIALSNAISGKKFILRTGQDSTGSRTLTWFSFSATATMTIATPCVVTTNRDIPSGTPLKFTTTGALPTGVVSGTTYYYSRVNSTTGNICTSLANVQAGTLIATSGSQSGTHTCAVQIRWAGGTEPTLTTGKYQFDKFGFDIIDATNGICEGSVVGQAF